MSRFRWIGVLLACFLAVAAKAQTPLESDEQTLRANKLPTDAKGLLAYFEKQTLKEGEAKHLEALVKKLGSDVYREREPAAKELIERRAAALPFLRASLTDRPSLEMKRRAELCINEIELTMQSDVISAAARVLAARQEPKAAEVLFHFLPNIGSDPFLEEELTGCVGRLTVHGDRVDPLLLERAQGSLAVSPAGRRVSRRPTRRRGTPRPFGAPCLAMPTPPWRSASRKACSANVRRKSWPRALVSDEALLRGQKIDTTETALLEFFRKRTVGDEEQQRLRRVVKELGFGDWAVRDRAFRQLVKTGMPALAFVKEAERDANMERANRARNARETIRETNNPAIPIAAAHLLAQPAKVKDASPTTAIGTLLAYIPFADDETVEQEILTCLTLLSLREPTVEPELVKALSDANATRRGAAAYVLGHVGAKEHVAKVQPLLDDLQPVVRLRAAQGMLAARNKVALPSFVSLLEKVPAPYLPTVEEILYHVAADKGPTETIVANSAASRQKAAKAWGKWLDDNQAKIDLTTLNDRETYLGLITVCEYDNRTGNIQGQVWEAPHGNGAKRFLFGQPTNTQILGAMDAHTLPNGRVLVAENSANRVTERDSKGDIKWEFRTPTNPIACQRLPNGNTFIASYNTLMEVTPAKAVVYQINRVTGNQAFYVFSVTKPATDTSP